MSPSYQKFDMLSKVHNDKFMENFELQKADYSTSWIENLAFEELNMEEAGVVNFNEHLSPQSYLEEESIQFMSKLRDLFELYSSKFNECRGGPDSGAQIKIFKISNTVNDFMLFRNSLRLIFSRKSASLITISLLVNGKDLYAPRMPGQLDSNSHSSHEISAHVGPFNKIKWTFQGEEVAIPAMVRHYLVEFIKNSAR